MNGINRSKNSNAVFKTFAQCETFHLRDALNRIKRVSVCAQIHKYTVEFDKHLLRAAKHFSINKD